MMQTTGVARFADLKLEAQRITLIADAQLAVFKMKKTKTHNLQHSSIPLFYAAW